MPRASSADLGVAAHPKARNSTETHAVLRWQAGSWQIEDRESIHGIYADDSRERAAHVTIAHGDEVQIGGCRVKLVSFGRGSFAHKVAQAYLATRDGLTGLLLREHVVRALDEDSRFSDRNESPFHVARYELRRPKQEAGEQPTVPEMLALREVARRAVEFTERLLRCLAPVVAGRTGPLKFAVSILGSSSDEACNMVEEVMSQVRGLLPDMLDLEATLVSAP